MGSQVVPARAVLRWLCLGLSFYPLTWQAVSGPNVLLHESRDFSRNIVPALQFWSLPFVSSETRAPVHSLTYNVLRIDNMTSRLIPLLNVHVHLPQPYCHPPTMIHRNNHIVLSVDKVRWGILLPLVQ